MNLFTSGTAEADKSVNGIAGLKLSIVIPARNEGRTIYQVAGAAAKYAGEVIVMDDCSSDNTAERARQAGAVVILNERPVGYLAATKSGFQKARGDIIVTLDGDGEHNPEDIPRLIKPILAGQSDLVMGGRQSIPRISERLINWLTRQRVDIGDSCTGYRAITKDLALKLTLKGRCTCGTLALEANHYGARIREVPVTTVSIVKPRSIAWHHVVQTFNVLGWLLKKAPG
jgi:glycosyltransferase involved in cell wall biosynthesis